MRAFLRLLILTVTLTSLTFSEPLNNLKTNQYMNHATERLYNIEEILTRLITALEKNDLISAQKNYFKAHYQYESIRPLIQILSDTDSVIHVHARDLENNINDVRFKGFHAVEFYLFQLNDITLSFIETQHLRDQIRFLIKHTEVQPLTINQLVKLLPCFTQQIITNELTVNDNIYSGADLGKIAANIEGLELILQQITLLLPKDYMQQLNQQINQIYSVLQSYESFDSYPHINKLSLADKMLIHNLTEELAETLELLQSKINVDAEQASK